MNRPTPRPTVVLVTPNLDVGGAQETIRNLARYLPTLGWRPVVCTLADGPLRADLDALGAVTEVLPERRSTVFAPRACFRELRATRRALLATIDRFDAHVVLQTQTCPALNLLTASLPRRSLQVWWIIQNAVFLLRPEHVADRPWLLLPKRLVHCAVFRLGSRAVTGSIVVSDDTEGAFRRLVGRAPRVEVVCNAVDLERYPADIDRAAVREELGVGPHVHLMTTVATFKEQKGHRFLVEAFAAVAPRHPELELLLVGDGALAETVREQARRTGHGDRIHFLGTRRDVARLLAASDSFVLASLWEGLPLALVEAMASGLPVVASAVSGSRQVMVDGRTGWVVPPGDSGALAGAIEELLSDRARAMRFAAAARERAGRFGAAEQAAAFDRLFRGADQRHARLAGRCAERCAGRSPVHLSTRRATT